MDMCILYPKTYCILKRSHVADTAQEIHNFITTMQTPGILKGSFPIPFFLVEFLNLSSFLTYFVHLVNPPLFGVNFKKDYTKL